MDKGDALPQHSPSITIPAASPLNAKQSNPADNGPEESSQHQGRARGTRILPALGILMRDQNYKEAFDYWLLSINDRHNYNDTNDSMWLPIKITRIDFYILVQQ